MITLPAQSVYYVVSCTTVYRDFDDAQAQAPELITAHLQRANELHGQGTLLLMGAFLDKSEAPLSTMAVHTSRAAAEAYLQEDPFVRQGKVTNWSIREWANAFAWPTVPPTRRANTSP